jgi:1,4-alpha-glucan branching enzyme
MIMAVYKDSNNGNVTFLYDKKNAKSVFVAGDFNNWDPKAGKMTKAKDGSFRARLSLTPGQHQYKFVADGTWVVDDDAQKNVQNELGTVNSVIEV